MSILAQLAACAGQWQGTNRLYDSKNNSQSFEIVMHVYTPEGVRGPAVEARYSPETA
jgi:hypothetical protein